VKRLGVFDDLKLRASYGRTGNQDIGNYNSLAVLTNTVNVFGGERAIGFAPSSLANPDLKWETTDGVDFGIDATMLRSRVSVTADYYHRGWSVRRDRRSSSSKPMIKTTTWPASWNWRSFVRTTTCPR